MAEFSYKFTPQAFRKLAKLPQEIQKRILIKLDFFCETNILVYAEKLTNSDFGQYRFRVGDYRIIFDVAGKEIVIINLGHRREIYR